MKHAATNVIGTNDGMLVSTDQNDVPDATLQSANHLHTFGNSSVLSYSLF